MKKIKGNIYFSPETDPKIDWDKLDSEAFEMLSRAHSIADAKMKFAWNITSHYRSPKRSVEVGGTKTDAHTKIPCGAFDLVYADSRQAYLIIWACMASGFKRVGINASNKHIHIDNSDTHPQNVFWVE